MTSSTPLVLLTDEEEESLKRLELRLTAQLAKVRKSLAGEQNQQMKEGQTENESRMEIEPKKAKEKEKKKTEEAPEVKSNEGEKKESSKEEKKCEDVISLLDDDVSLGEEEALFDAPKLFEEGGQSFWEACGRRAKTKSELQELRKDEVRKITASNAAKNKRIRSELDLPMEVEDEKKGKFANSKWDEKLQNLEDFERIAEEAKKALTLLLNVRQKALDIQDDAQKATSELQKLLGKMKKEEIPTTNQERGHDWGRPGQSTSFWSNEHDNRWHGQNRWRGRGNRRPYGQMWHERDGGPSGRGRGQGPSTSAGALTGWGTYLQHSGWNGPQGH
uniref:Uncharacterized protein n=1 Tax=Globodera rostochiensis TaxID=31243 RepID=A0A914HJK6_GLORO